MTASPQPKISLYYQFIIQPFLARNDMPVFFLNHVVDHQEFLDTEGSEFDSLSSARREGILAAKEIAANFLRAGLSLPDLSVEVTVGGGEFSA